MLRQGAIQRGRIENGERNGRNDKKSDTGFQIFVKS